MPALVGLSEVSRVALKTDPWSTQALEGSQQVWSKGGPVQLPPGCMRDSVERGATTENATGRPPHWPVGAVGGSRGRYPRRADQQGAEAVLVAPGRRRKCRF